MSCVGDGSSEIVDDDETAAAPTIVLYERNPWRDGHDAPTLALWADGTVVFAAQDHVAQAAIERAIASRTIAAATASLRHVPSYAAVTLWSDQPTVEITVRDGDRWRTVRVYGLHRGGVPDEIYRKPGSLEAFSRPSPLHPPRAFDETYHALLDLVRSTGAPFEPADLKLSYWDFDHARAAVPWPGSVPPPARDLVPAEREPGDPISYSHAVSTDHLPAMRSILAGLDGQTAIAFNGHRWSVAVEPRYRGQAVIDYVRRCAGLHTPE